MTPSSAGANLPTPTPLLRLEDFNFEELLTLEIAARLEWAELCAAEKDILGWGKALFPEKFSLPFCKPFHGYLVDIRGEEFTSTEGPRNHAKTLIGCFLIPLFQSIYEPNSFRHYLNVQATGVKAQAVNVAIQAELEQNELLRELCGDMVGDDRWTDMQFVTSKGVVFTALSAGQSIRGIHYKNHRPDYMVIDDLYDEEHITNVEATLKVNNWFWGSLYSARAKSRRTSIHLQGTAINKYDLLEKAKKRPDIKSKTFRAVTDWEKKTVLWPELNTFEQLDNDRGRMGSLIFFRELQNERRDDETSIIKHAWLYPTDGGKSWEYDPGELVFDKHHLYAGNVLTCDPSIGQKVQNDFTAVIGMYTSRYHDGTGTEWWIHTAFNVHLSLDKRIKLLQDTAQEQPPERPITECRIESIAGFKDFTEEVRRRTNLPVREIDHVVDKIANLESKSHFFENRKVHISSRIAPDLRDLIVHQLTSNYPEHDDLRDGVLLGLDSKPRSWDFVG